MSKNIYESLAEEYSAGAQQDILVEREKSWGDAVSTHTRIAQAWSGILNRKVTAHEVALCMTALKLVRASINPHDPDSLIDADGYIRIGQRIQGE